MDSVEDEQSLHRKKVDTLQYNLKVHGIVGKGSI